MMGWRRGAGLALLLAFLAGAAAAAEVPAAGVPDQPCARDDGPSALRSGLAYRNGDGMVRDAAAAVACLERAATQSVPQAMFILSHMVGEGEGSACDPAAARRWLQRAADLDYPEALQEQAMLEADPRRAAELLREAAHALRHRAQEHAGPAQER